MKLADIDCVRCTRRALYWDMEAGVAVHMIDQHGKPVVACRVRQPDSDPQPAHSDPCNAHLRCIAQRRGLV